MEFKFTVSQVNAAVKDLIESCFGYLWVIGEVSQISSSIKGHMYVTLQEDKNSVLKAVIWAGTRLAIRVEKGMQLSCYGKLTVYQSGYQLVIEKVFLAGEGNLEKILAERKKILQAEGLFDSIHKKPIPILPKIVGVVTSLHGSVLHDIIACMRIRLGCKLLVWPVAVQGQGALEQICWAINGFNAMESSAAPDVIIVARGGGSIEDLWVFNEEKIVRTVFASRIPIVSAIGHETDFTLIDYVSDYRAPTPSLAAEYVVPKVEDLLSRLYLLESRMKLSINQHISRCENRLIKVSLLSPASRLMILQEKMHFWTSGFGVCCRRKLEAYVEKLSRIQMLFNLLDSRQAILYYKDQKELVSDISSIADGDEIWALSFRSRVMVKLKVLEKSFMSSDD